MENERKIKIIALIALVVSLMGLTVAYASFSASLRISGTVTAKSAQDSWDVHFEASDGTTNLTPILTGKATIGTAATVNATQISGFNINFFAPGDSVTYNFNVVNDGILDAELTNVSIGTLTCAPAPSSTISVEDATTFCGELTMALTYNDGSEISSSNEATKELSKEGGTENLKLVVTWPSTSTIQLIDDVTVNIAESTFVYTQK